MGIMRAKPALLLDESKRSETGTNNGAANGRRCDQKEAGQRLAVSVRQIMRIVRRYRAAGLAGLTSKKRPPSWQGIMPIRDCFPADEMVYYALG